MTTDITELAQSEINDALAQLKQISEYPTPSTQYARVLRKYILALVEALEKAQQRIEELESDLSEWTDCKHDGATYYDMSGQERCGRCGADV
ncbi:DUF2076 domain-containing protein [Klebsiella pneumoniae]|uniref:DUF2076 domain-containing protein n=1 Tax=Klebsiella pneumoniae TaxID=573 RepID=UPI00211C669F|nr:DUF2076 domain-containing protein [Klebsiella pneumoniae]MDX4081124.1 DUF2076 domain-containing protein [Klebsiella pneumoniae]MDX4129101.1 DUF2076 domain-containing protein [Klebsiella pneumoniae]MEA4337398.1 DUF2076 domain-containing protein [Klebsiella pneumoniae]MEC7325361.1 DUF2076 domain-containing protein [Klebsiella pneumoniae]MEC7330862.1 DUF2076 domain-containing protein [Klebsiella pneumoniae]